MLTALCVIVFLIVLLCVPVVIRQLIVRFDSARVYVGAVFFCFLFCVTMAFVIPFSPSHDSYTMLATVRKLVNGEGLGNPVYYNFFATNRIPLAIYYLAAKVFESAFVGIRVLNFLISFVTSILISRVTKNILGKGTEASAVVMSALAFPYMIMSGPYIYPIAIFLSALTMYLYTSEKWVMKLISLFPLGLLFMMRMTSSIFIFGYLFFDAVYSIYQKNNLKMRLIKISSIAISLVWCILFGRVAGLVMNVTGFYAYPNFLNSAMVWTLDIGTRYDGEATGASIYTPIDPIEGDEIAYKFHELWTLYAENDPADYEKISDLNLEIVEDIKERAKENFSGKPGNYLDFLKYKITNLFRDSYRPYYYELNYNSPSFSSQLQVDWSSDYFLMMNVILLVSALSLIIYIISIICRKIKKEKLSREDFAILSFIASFLLNVVIMVCLTEVMKRYLFDSYVPITLFIIFVLIRLSEKLKFKWGWMPPLGAGILSMALFAVLLNTNNQNLFKNAVITVAEHDDADQTITFIFDEKYFDEYIEDGYMISASDQVGLSPITTIHVPQGKSFNIILGERIFGILGLPLDDAE